MVYRNKPGKMAWGGEDGMKNVSDQGNTFQKEFHKGGNIGATLKEAIVAQLAWLSD